MGNCLIGAPLAGTRLVLLLSHAITMCQQSCVSTIYTCKALAIAQKYLYFKMQIDVYVVNCMERVKPYLLIDFYACPFSIIYSKLILCPSSNKISHFTPILFGFSLLIYPLCAFF